jgi:hypothetical protein
MRLGQTQRPGFEESAECRSVTARPGSAELDCDRCDQQLGLEGEAWSHSSRRLWALLTWTDQVLAFGERRRCPTAKPGRPTPDAPAGSVLACRDLTVRDGQHAHTSRSQCHTLLVPRVDQAVPHGRHQTVRQHRHARRHRVQDEYEFIQACELSVRAGQPCGGGHGYERTSDHRQRRRSTQPGPLPSSDTPTHPARRRRRQGARGGLSADAKSTLATTTPPPADFRRRPPSTNRARHQRGSPGLPLNAAKVRLQFAHDPKEIHVEPRILGTRLRITRAYRSYGARVPSW